MTTPDPVIALIHAPLVGPSSWRWVAEVLRAAGRRALIPDLHARGQPSFDQFVKAIADTVAAHDFVLLVGHSGAGMLLPFAAQSAAVEHASYVFVDSGLPPLEGVTPVGPSRSSLEERADADGLLPPWHTWWGDDAMRVMVPDRERRRIVCSDIPRLPLAYFDSAPEVPARWTSTPGGYGYVLLSEVYREWADTASSYGWPVEEVLGSHLEVVNRPVEVAQAILRVAQSSRNSA